MDRFKWRFNIRRGRYCLEKHIELELFNGIIAIDLMFSTSNNLDNLYLFEYARVSAKNAVD